MAFIELYKFLHIDSDCLFTQTHVPHSLCVCVCDLVFCFAKVYRICMALRDGGGERGVGWGQVRVHSAILGSLVCSPLIAAKRKTFLPLPFVRLPFGFFVVLVK